MGGGAHVFSVCKETGLTPRLAPELRLKLAAWFRELVGISLNSKQRSVIKSNGT